MRRPACPISGSRAALAASVLALAAGALGACGGDDDGPAERSTGEGPAPRTEAGTTGDATAARVETVATGLEVPWDIAFLPGGGALVTERPGRVRLLTGDGKLREEPVARIDVAARGEGGLLGIALDPAFADNAFVYLYATVATGNRVTRHRLDGERLTSATVILDGIRASSIHNGGRIAFGPDGRLHVLTGDAADPDLAQDRASRNGKVLALTAEQYRGSGPAAPRVVSLGHRNPQGLDWEPGGGRLLATEHGPDGDDEINVIREGANYGWPAVTGADHGRFAAPLAVYERTIAPSGATFVSTPATTWTGDLLVAALRGAQLRRVSLDGDRVARDEALFRDRFGRLRAAVESPDGAIYVLTSNRDGRGDPTGEDDRIIRIEPPRR